MHLGIWLAYSTILAAVPTAARSEDNLTAPPPPPPVSLVHPQEPSSSKIDTFSSNNGSASLRSLNDTSQPSSRYSSLYDVSIEDRLNDTTGDAHCNRAVYGFDLDRESCFDAFRYLGAAPGRVSWGPRSQPSDFEYRLPARWSSGRFLLCRYNR